MKSLNTEQHIHVNSNIWFAHAHGHIRVQTTHTEKKLILYSCHITRDIEHKCDGHNWEPSQKVIRVVSRYMDVQSIMSPL